jgi:hypothetical protein
MSTEDTASPRWWAELQAELVADVQRRAALGKDPDCVARASRVLSGNERVSPVAQLNIYREQFWLRHTSSLVEDFPGVSGILGQEAWEPLAETYLQKYPPDSWTLRDLGNRFPEHVAACSELPHHALCVDMARLEWAYTELFDAPNSGPLDATKLSSIAPEAWGSARLVFSPSLRLLDVGYPVARLRRQLREALAQGHSGPALEVPKPEAQHLALYRSLQGELCYCVMDAVPARLLQLLHAGFALLQACETTAEQLPGSSDLIETQVGTWFGQWGAKGWIRDVSV